ncbi:MAG TPA: hypothetical protein VGE34_04140 [Candidatus Saccharimonadales bacterium]
MIDFLYNFAGTVNAGQVGIPTASADEVVGNVLRLVYFAAAIVCIITIVIAGILYSISNGDSGKVKTAKDAILYAVIGLVVVMFAFTITGFILGRFV